MVRSGGIRENNRFVFRKHHRCVFGDSGDEAGGVDDFLPVPLRLSPEVDIHRDGAEIVGAGVVQALPHDQVVLFVNDRPHFFIELLYDHLEAGFELDYRVERVFLADVFEAVGEVCCVLVGNPVCSAERVVSEHGRLLVVSGERNFLPALYYLAGQCQLHPFSVLLQTGGGRILSRMRQSQLFTKTRREAPADEVSKNAQLLVRAGYVHKEMAGVYSYLPLGLRTLNNIVEIIREEMNAIGGQELVMTALQDKDLWSRTDRWDDDKVDNWFKTSFKSGGETGLGITHEEPLTRIMTEHISSYRDLPVYAYQFQNKFRNELRAKSGIMRGKEFLMKDLYSFSKDEAEHVAFYDKARTAYVNVFKRAGIGEQTYVTFASGGIFSEFSEEFQTVSEAGEDTIYIDEEKGIAVNKEVLSDETLTKLGMKRGHLIEKKAIEAGNIFNLGTRFSEPLGLSYTDETGVKKPVVMGSYGIGPTRLMGIIVETLADDKGLVWPESVAPFKYHLVSLGKDGDEVSKVADALYEDLRKSGAEVLYDDRDLRAGEKFTESDLLGMPYRIVVGKDAVATGEFEVVNRATGTVEKKTRDDFLN